MVLALPKNNDLRAMLDGLSSELVSGLLGIARRAIPDGPRKEQPPSTRAIPHDVRRLRTLQRAIEWQLQLETGEVRTRKEIAKREGISQAAVTQTLRVLNVYGNGRGGLSPLQPLRTRRNALPSAVRPFRTLRNELLRRFETEYVAATLRAAGGNITLAAKLAQIDRKHFWRLVRRTGVQRG
jgi:DNA-binding NtrC family response regulator